MTYPLSSPPDVVLPLRSSYLGGAVASSKLGGSGYDLGLIFLNYVLGRYLGISKLKHNISKIFFNRIYNIYLVRIYKYCSSNHFACFL